MKEEKRKPDLVEGVVTRIEIRQVEVSSGHQALWFLYRKSFEIFWLVTTTCIGLKLFFFVRSHEWQKSFDELVFWLGYFAVGVCAWKAWFKLLALGLEVDGDAWSLDELEPENRKMLKTILVFFWPLFFPLLFLALRAHEAPISFEAAPEFAKNGLSYPDEVNIESFRFTDARRCEHCGRVYSVQETRERGGEKYFEHPYDYDQGCEKYCLKCWM